jgi:hypothetical protein
MSTKIMFADKKRELFSHATHKTVYQMIIPTQRKANDVHVRKIQAVIFCQAFQ